MSRQSGRTVGDGIAVLSQCVLIGFCAWLLRDTLAFILGCIFLILIFF